MVIPCVSCPYVFLSKVGYPNIWLTDKKGKKLDMEKMDKRNVNSENL